MFVHDCKIRIQAEGEIFLLKHEGWFSQHVIHLFKVHTFTVEDFFLAEQNLVFWTLIVYPYLLVKLFRNDRCKTYENTIL